MNWDRDRIFLATIVLALIPPAIFYNSYIARVFVIVLVFAVMAMGLNIVFGHTDQLFLFSGALMGTGSYTTVLLASAMGLPVWATLFVGALVAGVVGGAVCYVAARQRLSVLVIAILTLALQLSFFQFVSGASGITGGTSGRNVSGFNLQFIADALPLPQYTSLYYVLVVVFLATALLYYYIRNSRFGLAFGAIRQDELAAEALGIDVIRYKTIAGFVGAFLIGFAGPFYVALNSYVIPSMFTFAAVDTLILIMLLLGGLRTMFGPLVGALILTYVNEQLQSAGQWGPVILGFLLMALFLFFRQGIVRFLANTVRERTDLAERVRRMQSD